MYEDNSQGQDWLLAKWMSSSGHGISWEEDESGWQYGQGKIKECIHEYYHIK